MRAVKAWGAKKSNASPNDEGQSPYRVECLSMKLTEADRQRLDKAVQTAEGATSAEVVVVVRAESGSYRDVAYAIAGLFGLMALLAVLFVEWEVHPFEVPAVIVSATAVGALLGLRYGAAFTSAQRRNSQVDESALAAFTRCGVHRTSGRTGILVYVSNGEKLARLIPDQGIVSAVPNDVRAAWRRSLAAVAQQQNVEALALAIEVVGRECGIYLPRQADDVDELPSIPSGESAVELT